MSEIRQRQHQTGVRLSPQEHERLTEMARRLGVSRADVLRRALTSTEDQAREWRLAAAAATPRRYPRASTADGAA